MVNGEHLKCIDLNEYHALVAQVNKVRNEPYIFWVRENWFKRTIDIDLSITHEFLDDVEALQGNDEEALKVIADAIIADIRGARRKHIS